MHTKTTIEKLMETDNVYDLAVMSLNEGKFMLYDITPIHDQESLDKVLEINKDIPVILLDKLGMLELEPVFQEYIVKENCEEILLSHIHINSIGE